MQLPNLTRTLLSLALLLALLNPAGSAPIRAAVTLGPDGEEILNQADAQRAALLGPEFKDENAGFKVNTPAGARVIQRAGLELMSFIHDKNQWAGSVQLITFRDKEVSVAEYLRRTAGDLSQSTTIKAVQILESRETFLPAEPRPGDPSPRRAAGKLAVSMEAVSGQSKAALMKQELAVQVATNQFMVLSLAGPLNTRPDLEKSFAAMVSTFEIYDRRQVEEKRLAAVKAGQEWAKSRVAEELTARLLTKPQLFRIKVDNHDVGYISFEEREDSYLGMKGILVLVRSRTFPADGSIIMGLSQAFWAYSQEAPATAATRPAAPPQVRRFSMWDNGIKTVTFEANTTRTSWTTETGTLQLEPANAAKSIGGPAGGPADSIRYLLSVNRTMGNDRNILSGDTGQLKPVQVALTPEMPAPLPSVLAYLWPRIVDLSKPSRMGFVVFNSSQSKMGLRVLSVDGPETITIDGREIKATRLTDELIPGYTELWVDTQGKVLMMRTSDHSVLVPTTEEKMQQLWGSRLSRLGPQPK